VYYSNVFWFICPLEPRAADHTDADYCAGELVRKLKASVIGIPMSADTSLWKIKLWEGETTPTTLSQYIHNIPDMTKNVWVAPKTIGTIVRYVWDKFVTINFGHCIYMYVLLSRAVVYDISGPNC